LKLRSQFKELENPSAQNSRTVKDLAAATHWPTLEHTVKKPAWARQNHAIAGREKTVEKLYFSMFEMEVLFKRHA
jgi:hypothetical protein